MFHKWERIRDLPDNWVDLHRRELDLAQRQWSKEKSILRDPRKLVELEEQLATLWAIETGIIERLYTVDRGVTQTLIELGLGAIETLHQAGAVSRDAMLLIQDQRAALDFVFDFVSQKRQLSDSYIRELHQALTRNQYFCDAIDQFGTKFSAPLIKGAWKTLPNNPTRPDGSVHEYCPPEFVQDEIDQLLTWHQAHLKLAVPVDVESAWLHHRFTQIHPFQDGNGRVARALATLVFLRDGFLPLVIKDAEHKDSYVSALEAADADDLSSLVDLFARIQQDDLSNAIEIVRSLRGAGIARIARSAAERARNRREEAEQQTRALTDRLVGIAITRLQEIRGELLLQFEQERATLDVLVDENTPDKETWWSGQIVETAKQHGYWADLSKARRWAQLRLRLPGLARNQTNVVISFHQSGRITGLMVADAFLSNTMIAGPANENESPEGSEWEVVVLAEHPFSYSTSHRDPETGFRDWLEKVMDTALDLWQSRI